ncbi:zinc ribbon domain-containing protein [bacterium]|nr:zinc ribbon domain-containing protein [bacterium]
MPIYEYRCRKCENEFECLVIGSDEDISCPDCEGAKVERMMSSCSFKSSGTYSSPSGSSGCSSCSSGSCSSCH